MISKVYSIVPYGFDGKIVTVEGDMSKGLPSFSIVGMANKTITEARERVRSAIRSVGFTFPERKVTINLAPADLLKDGSFLDLPIALSILILSGQLLQKDVEDKLFVGELSLDGRIRPVRGIINIVEEAKNSGKKSVFVPLGNFPQASLISGIEIHPVETLIGLYRELKSQTATMPHSLKTPPKPTKNPVSGPILDHIRGQKTAKRALEVAIAGHHNILISGPPGAGKTLLAKAAINLLPALTPEEKIAITKIYSIAGLEKDHIIEDRPFRNPHHTASTSSIIGGGAGALPGEISLAHKGILFLDEIPEFQRPVLEALRQPLEDHVVTVSRVGAKTTYPAEFMLIATMNPCPCGYLGDPTHECTCSELQIRNYQKKLSGPLFDRIDIHVTVQRVENDDLTKASHPTSSEHSVVKNTITEAITRQSQRYKKSGFYNSSLTSFEVSALLKMTPSAADLLKSASNRLKLSARSYFKAIKVARTIADLEGASVIKNAHIAEALTYRKR